MFVLKIIIIVFNNKGGLYDIIKELEHKDLIFYKF